MGKKKIYWIPIISDGVVFKGTDDGKIYRGGSPSMVFIPIFRDRKDAINFGARAKKRLGARWCITREVRIEE